LLPHLPLTIAPDPSNSTPKSNLPSKLTLISVNIQSVISKKQALWESIDLYQPDFITGCETWLSQSVFDSEVLPENYRIYRKDRSDGYGGILIGIKKQYQSEIIDSDNNCEVCAVKVRTSSNSSDIMILISVYRPPNRDVPNYHSLCNAIYNIVSAYIQGQ